MAISTQEWLKTSLTNLIAVIKKRDAYVEGKIASALTVDGDNKITLELNDGTKIVSNAIAKTPLATDDIFATGTSVVDAVTVKQVTDALALVDGKTPTTLDVVDNTLTMTLGNGDTISTALDLDFAISIVVDKFADLPDPSVNDKKWAVVKDDTGAGTDDNGIYLSSKDANGNNNWVLVLGVPNDFTIQGQLVVGVDEASLGSASARNGDYGIIVTSTGIDYRISDGTGWTSVGSFQIADILASDVEFADGTTTLKAVTVAQLASLFTDATTISEATLQTIYDNTVV